MPSFDVVSEAEAQEVRNAVDQTAREMQTRYDFKGGKCEISLDGFEITILADHDMRLRAILDILKTKLAKREVSLRLLEIDDAEQAGGSMLRQLVRIKNGLKDEELKRLSKLIKGAKLKVQPQIHGEQLRVSGKKRDDLQEAIALMRKEASDLELQFTNFRD